MKTFKRAEALERYRSMLKTSKRFRSQYYEDKWLDFLDQYNNRPADDSPECNDKLLINYSLSTVRTIQSSTIVRNPKISVNPRNRESVVPALVAQHAVNREWEEQSWNRELKAAQLDKLILGHGWLKVGYRLTSTKTFDRENIDDEALAKAREEANAINMRTPRLGGLQLSDSEIRRQLEARGSVVLEDTPVVERVDPFHMFLDVQVESFGNIRWICQAVRVPLKSARANKTWKKDVRESLSATKSQATTNPAMSNTDIIFANQHIGFGTDDESEWTIVYEHYDLVEGTFSIFADTGDDFLLSPRPMPFRYGHPFWMMRNYEVPSSLYPMGEIEAIQSIQDKLNDLRNSMVSDATAYTRKYRVIKGSLDEDAWAALESAEEDLIFEVDHTQARDIDPDKLVKAIDPPPVDGTKYQVANMLQQDLYNLSGVSEYQRGGAGLTSTATEASILNDAANTRFSEKLSEMELAMREVAKRVIMNMQQYQVLPRILRVAGVHDPETNRETYGFFEFDRDMLQGEFDFEVEAGSTEPLNDTARRQLAQQVMTIGMPGVQLGILNPKFLYKYVFEELLGVQGADKLFADTGDGLPGGMVTGLPAVGGMPVQSAETGASQPQLGGIGSQPGAGIAQVGGGPPPSDGVSNLGGIQG